MMLNGTFDIPIHVVSREVEGELVLLDLESGIYFALDSVGARIWALISDGASLETVRDTMLAEFNVEAETLERDIRTLMNELERRKLVEAHKS